MVRIFISPEGDPLWTLRLGGAAPSAAEAAAAAETLSEAQRLLGEAPPAAQKSTAWEVLRCAVLVAARTPESVDDAISRLAAVLEASADCIPALNLLSTAFLVSGQAAKARNILKRLLKLPGAGPGEHAEASVDAWLQLAAISDESGKPDQAAEAVQRALALDASAGRAWEYLGGLAERELRYADAAGMYEKAWACEGGAGSAPIGFKLAFNYLKAGRATAAIDVGRKVLAAFPDYPRIQEEVIAKARALVRV
jgi:tetratricopeptide repeat protein 21B